MAPTARYDQLADWYDAFVRSVDLTATELDTLEQLLGGGPGRCLDLGCGTGIAFERLVQLSWSVIGVDVSPSMLEVARAGAQALDVELVEADAARLPFADASFDAVISLMTHTDFDERGRRLRRGRAGVASGRALRLHRLPSVLPQSDRGATAR